MKPGCVFCQIVGGQIPSVIRLRNQHAILIDDRKPMAPQHALVIPVEHWGNLGDLIPGEYEDLLPDVFQLIDDYVCQEGILNSGFRVIINSGPDAGQTVHHLHFHVLGGALLKNDFGA